jgi:hypothetical protein
MRLPGFTATTSLQKTTEDYRVATAPAGGVSGQEVVPQYCVKQGNSLCCFIPYTGWVCRHIYLPAYQ